MTVVASDLGSPPRNSTANVRITIADINDNPPLIIVSPGYKGPLIVFIGLSQHYGCGVRNNMNIIHIPHHLFPTAQGRFNPTKLPRTATPSYLRVTGP